MITKYSLQYFAGIMGFEQNDKCSLIIYTLCFFLEKQKKTTQRNPEYYVLRKHIGLVVEYWAQLFKTVSLTSSLRPQLFK